MFDSAQILTLPTRDVADEVAASHARLLGEESALLQLAAHWADRHAEPPARLTHADGSSGERYRTYGGVGAPKVGEFAAAELGTLQGMTTNGAAAQMADALDLRHRFPRLWSRVCAAEVRVWKARKVAQTTRHLDVAAAAIVDARVCGPITSVSGARFETILEAAVIEADPAQAAARARLWEADRFVRSGTARQNGLKVIVARANAGDVAWFMATLNRLAEILLVEGDLTSADVRRSRAIGIIGQPVLALSMLQRHAHPMADESGTSDEPEATEVEPDKHVSLRTDGPGVDPSAARPRVVLYVHLSEGCLTRPGVVRMEGHGPITTDQLRRLFEGTACSVSVRPVVDRDPTPVDAYEIPQGIREAVWLRDAGEMFPYGASTSRAMDLDHTRPFVSSALGGPPGQTGPANLGLLSRSHHRLKTFSRWKVHQPSPGIFLWRSPQGAVHLVCGAGTIPLGRTVFAEDMWWSAAFIERGARVAA